MWLVDLHSQGRGFPRCQVQGCDLEFDISTDTAGTFTTTFAKRASKWNAAGISVLFQSDDRELGEFSGF